MANLTDTQQRAFDYIRNTIERSGMSPTLREICSHMGYSAVGSAQDVVAALRKKGFLQPADNRARSFVLTEMARRMVNIPDGGDMNTFAIPCVGSVPAGNPVEAVEEHVATMRISMAMLPRPLPRADELFAVQADGDSMVDAGILDGDWLVVKMERESPVESIIVARVDDEVTCKRLMRNKDYGWYLKPENPKYEPIMIEERPFQIVGRVVALQRSLS